MLDGFYILQGIPGPAVDQQADVIVNEQAIAVGKPDLIDHQGNPFSYGQQHVLPSS